MFKKSFLLSFAILLNFNQNLLGPTINEMNEQVRAIEIRFKALREGEEKADLTKQFVLLSKLNNTKYQALAKDKDYDAKFFIDQLGLAKYLELKLDLIEKLNSIEPEDQKTKIRTAIATLDGNYASLDQNTKLQFLTRTIEPDADGTFKFNETPLPPRQLPPTQRPPTTTQGSRQPTRFAGIGQQVPLPTIATGPFSRGVTAVPQLPPRTRRALLPTAGGQGTGTPSAERRPSAAFLPGIGQGGASQFPAEKREVKFERSPSIFHIQDPGEVATVTTFRRDQKPAAAEGASGAVRMLRRTR